MQILPKLCPSEIVIAFTKTVSLAQAGDFITTPSAHPSPCSESSAPTGAAECQTGVGTVIQAAPLARGKELFLL